MTGQEVKQGFKEFLSKLLPEDQVESWFNTKIPYLGNKSPNELINLGEIEALEEVLHKVRGSNE